jgi:hypothetical protein
VLRFAVLLLASTAAFSQYKLEPAGEPPSEVAPDILVTLSKSGTKIEADNGSTLAEIWMRASAPRIPPPPKSPVALSKSAVLSNPGAPSKLVMPSKPMEPFKPKEAISEIPSGALVGVLRLAGKGSDMRGQPIAAGSYTLRYLGASNKADALHRDFILLIPAAIDKSTRTITRFDTLLDESRKASGTTNPAMFGFWKAGGDFKPGIEKSGPADWVLQTKLGDVAICILMGQTE